MSSRTLHFTQLLKFVFEPSTVPINLYRSSGYEVYGLPDPTSLSGDWPFANQFRNHNTWSAVCPCGNLISFLS